MTNPENPAFDGAALEKRLAEGTFEQSGLPLIGMVKAAGDKGQVSFAPANCELWVDIPSSMIEQAEFISNQRCRDHSHAVFRLMLKAPKNSEAKVLAALLSAHASGSDYGGEGFPDPTQVQPSALMGDDSAGIFGGFWFNHCHQVPIRTCVRWRTIGGPPHCLEYSTRWILMCRWPQHV